VRNPNILLQDGASGTCVNYNICFYKPTGKARVEVPDMQIHGIYVLNMIVGKIGKFYL